MVCEVENLTFVLRKEVLNLEPRRKLSSRFKEMRNYYTTHPTLLENMIYHTRKDPFAQLFLHGCKSDNNKDYIRLIGSAVYENSNDIQIQQFLIHCVQESHIYEIGETETAKHRIFDSSKGTYYFNLEDAWPSIVVDDLMIVSKEAEGIFEMVQEMSGEVSPEFADLFWWNLSPYLSCVIAVCCAANLTIDTCYTAIVSNVSRIVNGDFPANELGKRFSVHPLARIYFGC